MRNLPGRFWRLMLLLGLLAELSSPLRTWRAKKLLMESDSDDLEEIVDARDRSRRSDDSGSFSDSDWYARRTSCKDPGIPDNGLRTGSSFRVGSQLRFSCKSGFRLRGSRVLTCRRGDEDEPRWDSRLPQCVGKITRRGCGRSCLMWSS